MTSPESSLLLVLPWYSLPSRPSNDALHSLHIESSNLRKSQVSTGEVFVYSQFCIHELMISNA
eukprot:UN21524